MYILVCGMYMCTYICMSVYVCIYMCIYIYRCVCTYLCVYVWVYLCVPSVVYVYVYEFWSFASRHNSICTTLSHPKSQQQQKARNRCRDRSCRITGLAYSGGATSGRACWEMCL